ncbi:uncharacterized protein LOC119734128 [Patiria miniata]|uniref:Uncharacterized protein n=1 Tax=Patiria miniata TaxID=46514 RepID=A0A914AID7_PATMI|nr:uncharacterized protein LOC119734128 [Patiria miniata]
MINPFLYRFDPGTDLLVEWKDGTQNVVKLKDVKLLSKKLRKGSRVKMQWGRQTWEGEVIDVEDCSDDLQDSDSDSDVPLAKLRANNTKRTQDTDDSTHKPARCDDFMCGEEVWAACT